MLKLFVTGDNHIGLKYANHREKEVLIQRRFEAFDEMIAAANREKCALFVITGDLFHKTKGIPKKDIKTVLDKLSKFDETVVILPGNHDFYDPEAKLWIDFEELLKNYDNIILLREFSPYTVHCDCGEVILYPALCKQEHSAPGANNLEWIRQLQLPRDEVYRIGIAHGAVEGESLDKEGEYYKMSRAELETIGVDAWLIGHTHVPFPRNLTEEFAACEKILNAGTHVQTDVACNTEGICFVVEISPDKTLRAKKFVSGNLRFYRKNIAVTAGRLAEVLERELAELEDESVVDVILSGAVTMEEYEDRTRLIEQALKRFTEYTYSEAELSKLITKQLVNAEFPETSFSAKLLTALLEDPKEAHLAYELLSDLKGGKKK